MSTQNRPLIAGLAAPGLLWLATSVALGQTEPAPASPPNPAPTSPATFQALLLSNGQVVRGDIIEDVAAGEFRLNRQGGMVSYQKARVLKAGQSVEDLYQYQAARLPVGDPEERMKLARWCLAEHLPERAREQLRAIKALCPDDREATRMLYNLDANAVRPSVDPEIRRTSAESSRVDAPNALDERVVRKAEQRYNTLPVIFDLPPAAAVARTQEFAGYVQPILLNNCARCHNEKYPIDFQLVVARQRDLSHPNVIRANLDATLKLINPDDPAQSRLLTVGLMAHGGNKNPIFHGANDAPYQILDRWVKLLRPAASPGSTPGRQGPTAPEPAEGDGFAADRADRPTPLPSSRAGQSQSQAPDADFPAMPGPRTVREQYQANADFSNPSGPRPEFLTPFAVTGQDPYPGRTPTPAQAAPGRGPAPSPKNARPGATPTPTPAPNPNPKSNQAASPKPGARPIPAPNTAKPVGPDAVVVRPVESRDQLPGMNQDLYPPKPKAADADAPDDPEAARKKPRPIDPALLEQMMKGRNGNP